MRALPHEHRSSLHHRDTEAQRTQRANPLRHECDSVRIGRKPRRMVVAARSGRPVVVHERTPTGLPDLGSCLRHAHPASVITSVAWPAFFFSFQEDERDRRLPNSGVAKAEPLRSERNGPWVRAGGTNAGVRGDSTNPRWSRLQTDSDFAVRIAPLCSPCSLCLCGENCDVFACFATLRFSRPQSRSSAPASAALPSHPAARRNGPDTGPRSWRSTRRR